MDVYLRRAVRVCAVFDPSPDACERARAAGLTVEHDLDGLLAREDVELVDVATPAAVRPEIVERALLAGKHVLAQKPFALDLGRARELVELAERRRLVLAVNVNARWSGAWRAASQLIAAGAVGRVRAVSHVLDFDLTPHAGGPLDTAPHFAVSDVLTHWVDISGTWIDWTWPVRVRAEEHRLVSQPAAALSPLGATVSFSTAAGVFVNIHLVGVSAADTSWAFWTNGEEGTVSGQGSFAGPDRVQLTTPSGVTVCEPPYGWVPHGFEGAICETLEAVASGSSPANAVRSHLPMLAVTLAATASAEQDGAIVRVDDPFADPLTVEDKRTGTR
jgi:predicted dehydrogenase